jgi:transmembrane sensor
MSRIDDEALAWMARQADRPLDDDAQATFEAWYAADTRHQGAYLRAQAIWHSLDKTTIQTDLRPATPLNRNRRVFLLGGAAAATGAAAVLVPKLGARLVLKTATGEFRKVPLADRSIASLNSGSHVEVSMTPTLRRVILKSGEAWFKVAKDPQKPFVVEAGDVRVQAVGTAFSVRRRDTGADVMVTEGIVEAWSDEGSTRHQIVAGEQAFVPDRIAEITVSAAPAEIERKLAWRDGNLVFDNETLLDAVADFNRYNTQKIIITDPALRNRRFVGQYRIDAPQQFADDVHTLLRVPVSVTPDGILIGASHPTIKPPTIG